MFPHKNMAVVLMGLLLLGGASAFNVAFESSSLTVHMAETVVVLFNVSDADLADGTISVSSSNVNVATVDSSLDLSSATDPWTGSLNVSGVFLGTANIVLTYNSDSQTVSSDPLVVTVVREERVIDSVFVASVAILVSILYINFGCAMDWEVCRRTIKKPIGPTIGFFCQFVFMPLLSYGLGKVLFPDSPEMQLGMFFTGVSPGGGASNIWTVLLGGNLNLSITMTTISTIAAFGMMPLWIFTLGAVIFERGNLAIPYTRIATFAIGLIIPLGIGYIIQRKLPRVSKLLVRILKPFSTLLIVFIIVFAIVTNLYLFQLFSWQIVVAGIGLPWLGYLFGMIMAFILRQPGPDITAISVETGVQNTGIAIFLLRFSLPQPAADLTTVAPVSCAIMTPIPLTILYIVKLIMDRRKRSLAASSERLQDIPEPIPVIAGSKVADGV